MKRVTPSQEVSNFDIGWLAGIVEGEGTLSHYYSKRKGLNRHGMSYPDSPYYGVTVVNTDMEIINKCKFILEKLGFSIKIYSKKAISIKPCFELHVRRRIEVENLLKILEPHMYGEKKTKALKMLKFFAENPFYSRNFRCND